MKFIYEIFLWSFLRLLSASFVSIWQKGKFYYLEYALGYRVETSEKQELSKEEKRCFSNDHKDYVVEHFLSHEPRHMYFKHKEHLSIPINDA